MANTKEVLTSWEYKILTKSWDWVEGATLYAATEFCIESGFMDYSGVVTPKGQKAIEDYERSLK